MSTTWQESLKTAIRSTHALLLALDLTPEQLPSAYNPKSFPCLIPQGWLDRMEKGNPNDPLLKQVLPSVIEEVDHAQGMLDPLHEKNFQPTAGIIHKYKGRLLWTITGACPIHCRYCFRRHFNYAEHTRSGHHKTVLAHIQQQTDVCEVILSGGDPLSWRDDKLHALITSLARIPHLEIVRLHTRFPIVLPERITPALLKALKSRLSTVIVVHTNHPNELNDATAHACKQLHQAGIVLLNQSVLLKGVNDSCETLKNLSYKLFKQNIMPYYLHRLDPVQGAMHFAVEPSDASTIVEALQASVPGYLMPKWVAEIPGQPYKTPLMMGKVAL